MRIIIDANSRAHTHGLRVGKNKTKKSGPYVSETVNLMRVTGDDKATNSSSPGLMETHSFYPFYYERLLRYRHTARPTSTNTHFYGSLVSFYLAQRQFGQNTRRME